MRFYAAQYRLKDPSDETKREIYSSYIWAESYGHACKLAVDRNIGEFVVGVLTKPSFNPNPMPSALYKSRNLISALHTLTFYTWIATHANLMSAVDSISDNGLIHELIHELHHPGHFAFRKPVYDRLVDLERSIPGLKLSQVAVMKVKVSP